MWSDGLWEMVEDLSARTFSREEDDWLRPVVRAMPARVEEALRLRGARSPDRVALADASAWNAVWFAVAAELPGDRARRRRIVAVGERAARRVGETLTTTVDPLLAAGAAIAAARSVDAAEGTAGAPAGVERFVDDVRNRGVERLQAVIDGDAGRRLRDWVYWQGQSLALVEAIASAHLHRPRSQAALATIAAAHRRASGETLSDYPTVGVGDDRWLAQMMLGSWARVPALGGARTRAVCFRKRIVLLGEGVEAGTMRAAARGRLDPLLMHELLHTIQSRGPSGSGDAKRLDEAIMEGAHQRWAEGVCQEGRDPVTGLAGSEYVDVHRGWQGVVTALASASGRDPLVAARELSLSERGFTETLSAWCGYPEGFVERLWPVMDRAFHDRDAPGVGDRAASEALAALGL